MLLGRGIGAFKASRAVGRERRREEGVARALEESKLEAMAGIERHTRREAQIRVAAIKNVLQKWSNQTVSPQIRVDSGFFLPLQTTLRISLTYS